MFNVKNLGFCKYESPLKKYDVSFINDSNKILLNPFVDTLEKSVSMELAGPRENIFFNTQNSKAAIVTCGGLCPGLNDVIRALVFTLHYRYGVQDIFGIRYGYAGFVKHDLYPPLKLDINLVQDIHLSAGSILGTSRGEQEATKILDFIKSNNINMLFCIGGDGTLRGATAIHKEAEKNKWDLAVVGIPKTIDNDISYISKSFGFDTAVDEATNSIMAAHAEARGHYNGVGLVKLMGRHSGFIACQTALANNDANFVLIPEVPFDLYGNNGFIIQLFKRLQTRRHAVVIVAEGAGQELFNEINIEKDASGNKKLNDIGMLLKDEIKKYSQINKIPVDVKYIDPSYMIRSKSTISNDGIYCIQLAQNAVHAAIAGKTNVLIGHHNEYFTNIPIEVAISKRKTVLDDASLWFNVLEATGQPYNMKN